MKRIALLLGLDLGYCRDVLRGIQRFASQQNDWVFHDAPPDPLCLGPLREWKPDGVIAHLFLPKMVTALRTMRIPVVNTTSALAKCDFPLVEADHFLVGKMAASHFLRRGYENFGYYGSTRAAFSFDRQQGYSESVASAGHSVSCCLADYLPRQRLETSWKQTDTRVQRWLRKLPKPVAIFASHDTAARDLADACIALGLKVPQEVALLGVDNDDAVCILARPDLSSIKIPAEQIGFQAAKILQNVLDGKKAPEKPMFLPPVRVVTRRSTDLTAVNDELVRLALSYIHNHYAEPISVDSISAGVGVGRRSLERKMAEHLGKTVLEELQQARIESAQQLLDETDESIKAVALKVGFSSARRFSDVFHRIIGATPMEYRRCRVMRARMPLR